MGDRWRGGLLFIHSAKQCHWPIASLVRLGEMFASKAGLGSMIMTDMQLLQGEEMMTVTIVLFGFAAIANGVLLWIEHRLHRRV